MAKQLPPMTRMMLKALPGQLSDAEVVKLVEFGINNPDHWTKEAGNFGVSDRTGKQMSKEYLWDMMPVLKHYMDGSPQNIQIGKKAPDGVVFHSDGQKSTLHEQIRSLGGGKPRALTLLNFGSFT